MADDLKDEIKLGVDASGVETGISKIKRSFDDLDKSVDGFGKRGSSSFEGFGQGANKASGDLDRATRNMVNSLQRQIAAAEAGGTATRDYQESLARLRGANMDVLRPYLDQLDQANGKTKAAEDAANSLTGTIRNLGSAFGGMAAGLAAAFSLRAFVSEIQAAQDAQIQLTAVLKSTGETAGWSQQQLNAMAAQMARSTKFSGDEINVAQTRMLSYTGIVGEQFPRAMQAAADMSARMGMDIASAAEQIGRALDIPSQGLTALTRQGFRFTDAQKELIQSLEASGKTAEAQKIILDALSSSYGGAASAARNTLSGAFNEVGKSTKNLMGAFDEATGASDSLQRALESIATAVNGTGDALRENEAVIKTVLGALGGTAAVASLRLLPPAIAAVGGAITALSAVVAANPIALAVLGVGAVVGGGIAAVDAYGKTADGIRSTIDALQRENQRSERALQDAIAGGRRAGADNIRATIAERIESIRKLNLELDKLDQKRGGAGPGRGTIIPQTVGQMQAEATRKAEADAASLEKLRSKLSGIPPDYVESMKEIIRLNEAGVLVGKEYTDALRQQQDTLLKKTGATKSDSDVQRAALKEQEEQAKLLAELSGLTGTFYADWERLNKAFAQGKLSTDQLTEAQAKLLEKQPAIKSAMQDQAKAIEAANKAADREIDAITKQFDAMGKADEAITRARQSAAMQAEQSVQKLQDELKARQLATAMGISQARAIEMVSVARLKEQATKIRGDGGDAASLAALEKEIAAREQLIDLIGQRDAAAESDAMWTSFESAAHSAFINIENGWDGTVAQLKKSMKTGLLDWIWNSFAKPILLDVRAVMTGTGLIGGTGAAMAGQAGSGILGSLGASAAGNMLFGGSSLAAIGSSIGTGFMATLSGTSVGAAASAYSAAGMGGVSAGLQIGAALPWIGGALALASAFGLFSSTSKRGDTLIGTLGQTGGVRDADLMRRDGSMFSGPDWFLEEQGKSKMDSAIQKQWADSLKVVTTWTNALGLSTDKIAGFTTTLGTETLGDHGQLGIRLDNDGTPLSEAEIQQKITQAIRSGNNDLAEQIIGSWEETTEKVKKTIRDLNQWTDDNLGNVTTEEDVTTRTYKPSEFARDGEQAIDTLQRLATSLQATNAAFELVNQTLYESTLAGADMASQLVDQFGSLDQFNTSTGSYVQNFYPAADLRANLEKQINEELAKLDLKMPDTFSIAAREQWRQMAEAQDLSTEAGRETWATLVQLSEGFAQVTAGAGAFNEAVSGMGGTIKGILDNAMNADSAESASRQASEAFESTILNSITGALTTSIGDMISQSLVAPLMESMLAGATASSATLAAGGAAAAGAMAAGGAYAAGANAQGGAAAASAMASGGASAASSMASGGAAAGAMVGEVVAQARAQIAAMGQILTDPDVLAGIKDISSAVGGLAGDLFNVRQSFGGGGGGGSVNYSNSTMYDDADKAAADAKKLADAWTKVSDTILEEVRKIRGVIADEGEQGLAYWQAQLATQSAMARAGDQDAAGRLTGISRSLLSAAQDQAGSSLELAQIRAATAQSLQTSAQWAQAFAGGSVKPIAPTSTPVSPTSVTAPIVPIAPQQPMALSIDVGSLLSELRQTREQSRTQAAALLQAQSRITQLLQAIDDRDSLREEENYPVTVVEARP